MPIAQIRLLDAEATRHLQGKGAERGDPRGHRRAGGKEGRALRVRRGALGKPEGGGLKDAGPEALLPQPLPVASG